MNNGNANYAKIALMLLEKFLAFHFFIISLGSILRQQFCSAFSIQYSTKFIRYSPHYLKQALWRSSCGGSAVTNWTNIHEDEGSIPGLTHWVKDPVLP